MKKLFIVLLITVTIVISNITSVFAIPTEVELNIQVVKSGDTYYVEVPDDSVYASGLFTTEVTIHTDYSEVQVEKGTSPSETKYSTNGDIIITVNGPGEYKVKGIKPLPDPQPERRDRYVVPNTGVR